MQETDVVIVGCGVAGGMLAAFLSRAGFRVIVLEKRPRIGVPIRCGEAAGSRKELSHFLPFDEDWVSAAINSARLFAPGGAALEKELPGVGVVLKRDRFDQALASLASSRGAEVRVENEAVGIETERGFVVGVRVYDHMRRSSYKIGARVTVGADGIESFIGRLAGLRTHLRASEIHSCFQYLLEGNGFPTDTMEIHVGKKIAPGGYAWVIPKGKGLANVGIGVHPGFTGKMKARDRLEAFLKERYPRSRVRAIVAGATSGVKPLKTMVADGVLLVGEAAGQNNPFSGGGIMNALEGAEDAAIVLEKALHSGDTRRKQLQEYDERWQKRAGRTMEKFFALRRFFLKLEDGEMDSVVSALKGILRREGGARIDYAEIFKAAFETTPQLVWKSRALLW